MDSYSEGGRWTSAIHDGTANFYINRETLACGVIKMTRRKEMKTGLRCTLGLLTLGISEMAKLSKDYLSYSYSYEGQKLGESENEAAERAYEIGYDCLRQERYEEAIQWFNIAYKTCNRGYSRINLFKDKRDFAIEKLKKRDEKEEQKQQELEEMTKIEKSEQDQKAKQIMMFCSAEVYQRQSQIEVTNIPDSILFTEVQENKEEDNNYEEMSETVIEENDILHGTTLDNMKEIDSQVESLLDLLTKNTDNKVTKFQKQIFYKNIYCILDSIDSNNVDLKRLLENIFNTVANNVINMHNFFSLSKLVVMSNQLQRRIVNSLSDQCLLNELKSTWLHQMLKMKNIEHCKSDLTELLKLSARFELNFFVTSTQKILRFYNKYIDLLNFFARIQNCPLTKKSKQHFIQTLPDGSSPLHLLAESVIESYFCLKFANYQSQMIKQLEILELDPSTIANLKVVAVESKSEHEQVIELAKIMHVQFTDHWNFSYVDQQLGLIDTAGKIQSMVKILLHVYDFEGTTQVLKINELPDIHVNCKEYFWIKSYLKEKLMQIKDNIDPNITSENRLSQTYNKENKWIKQVHEILIHEAFPAIEYSLNDEFKKLNVFAHLKCNNYDGLLSCISLNNKQWIDETNQNNIKEWGRSIRSRSGALNAELHKMIAVVNIAVKLHFGYSPRDVQNMALLLLLDKMEGNEGGRLLQVNTGEGKTLIVAMFAAIMTLRGHKVDVITSSPELAEPQCQEMAPFFQYYFDLTTSYVTPYCADNNRKKAYKADIVYGTAQDFQGDILKEEYSQLGTRSGRKFDVAIVDEVDSMLIDGFNHMVMLSSPVPGMDNLEVVLATIWNHIGEIESCLIEKNGRVYIIDSSNRINEDGSMKPDEECIDDAKPIEKTKLEFITEQTEHFMRLLLRDYEHLDLESKEMCKEFPEIHIPLHLREFVLNVQLPKWVKSAIFAKYAYKINQHYIIRNGKIAPVDSCNTGIVQENMHLSNGVHQFLQIKHGAKLFPETYTTNYISNVAFFKRYGSRLVGLTGTLGSESAQQLLRKIYNVDTVILPPFKRKQYRQLRPLFAKSKDEWLVIIAQSCIRKLEMGRAVLIIAQYLSQVDKLHDSLVEQGINKNKIFLYKTEKDSDVVKKELKSGEIIVATNIAGRGTDISVSKDVEKRGGLHVCLTSLPVNERVEEQNFGRTSRTGNRGTGQFVLLQEVDSTLDELKSARDEIEKIRLLEGEIEIEKVLMKDRIFAEFCSLLKHVRNRFGTKDRLECENNARAVEERFGLWLKEHEDELTSDKDFQPFCELIKKELEFDTFIKNPYFHVLNGNLEMDRKEFEQAIKKYSRAIELDDRFLSNAYYNRGYCKLVLSSKNSMEELAKEAVEDFRRAKEIIEDRFEKDLFVIQQSATTSKALSEQVKHMFTLFAMQKNAIEHAIGKGKGFVKVEIERLEETESKNNADDVKKYIEVLRANRVRVEEGIIGEALQKHDSSFNVILNSIESSLSSEENLSLFEREIETFRNNGNLGCFKIHSIKPIDWGSVICLALIAIGQIIAGIAIGVFTVGVGEIIGFGIMSEGISDLFTCVFEGIIYRNFSWKDWAIQKAVSFCIAIACAGIFSIKHAIRQACIGFKQTTNMVGKEITTIAKSGWKLIAKRIGLELGKDVAVKLFHEVRKYSMNCELMPFVEKKIQNLIQDYINTIINNNEDVDKLLEVDCNMRNAHYQQKIIQKALEIFQPNLQTNIAGLMRILQQIEKTVSGAIGGRSESNLLSKIGNDLLEEFGNFSKFIKDMKIEITSMAVKHKNMETEKQKSKCQKPIALDEQVKLEVVGSTHDQLSDKVVQAVASKICNIIKNNMALPLVSYAANEGVDGLTAEVNKSLSDSIKFFKSHRRFIMLQDGDIQGMVDKNHKQGITNPRAAAKAIQVIGDLENGGEAGLPLLGIISDTINRPVTVLDEKGNVMMYIGENKPGKPVYLQYHEAIENRSGYWTGPNNKEPNIVRKSKNNRLFDTIAGQRGMDPDRLRRNVCDTLKSDKHLNLLANGARDFVRLESSKEKYFLLGGVIG